MSDALPAPWRARPVATVVGELLPPDEVEQEAAALEQALPGILARFDEGAEAAQENLSHLAGLMRASEDTAAKLAGRGFFSSLWHKLTGSEARDAGLVRLNLAKVQARAVVVTERLLERQAYLEHATRYLGARTELMAMENLKLKAVLVRLGQRVFERFDRLEGRVDRLERRSDGLERRVALSEIFQSAFSPAAGRPYATIEDGFERALTLAYDFVEASGGDWRPIDLHRLQRLALGEAALDGTVRVASVIEALLDKPFTGTIDAWVANGGLRQRLMAPMDSETELTRRFYPVHFLLQRPAWFLEQGLPRSAGVPVILAELTAHGLETGGELGLWSLLRLLLEERLAWRMESAVAAADALPAPVTAPSNDRNARTLQVVPDHELTIRRILLVEGEVLALAPGELSNRPSLYHLMADEPRRVVAQPRFEPEALGSGQWALGGGTLWTISEDRRGADGLSRDTGPKAWRWSAATFPALAPLLGLCAREGVVIAWDRHTVFRWSADRKLNARCDGRVVDAAPAPDGFHLLEEDRLRFWPDAGDPYELPGPEGFVASRIEASPADGTSVVLLGAAAGLELRAPWQEAPPLRADGLADYAVLPDGRVLRLEVDGGLTLWDPARGTSTVVEADGGGNFTLLATDARGRVAAYEPNGHRVVVFEVT